MSVGENYDADDSDFARLISKQNDLLERLVVAVESCQKTLQSNEAQLEHIRFSAALPMQEEYFEKIANNQLGYLETVEFIAKHKASLARFGDGELGLAAFPYRNIGFQKGSPELARSLRAVLSSTNPNLLVALPGPVEDRTWMTMFARNWGALRSSIPSQKLWGIASVSRAGAFKFHRQEFIDAWRRCWDDRDVTVVTGEGSRFEAIEPLFSNVRSIEFVYGPAKNAFENLPALKEKVLSSQRDLVLLSLGPAATVLAKDLADLGIQTIDVGHINNSYSEAFEGGAKPERLPFKKG